jgi:hypothetical protein
LKFLRFATAALPQIFLLLLLAGIHGWLGRWQHTDAALTTLLLLFVLVPFATLALLLVEVVRFLKTRGGTGPILFALCLVVESLIINLYLLSRMGMH